MKVPLVKLAHARSGDKGDRSDISLFAPNAEVYELLAREVTADRVAAHFAGIATGPVVRYELRMPDGSGAVAHVPARRDGLPIPGDTVQASWSDESSVLLPGSPDEAPTVETTPSPAPVPDPED